MTGIAEWPRPKRGRLPRARRWLLRLAAAAALFGLGFALSDALDDNPDPDRSPTQTLVRTLGPLPLSAPPTVTVTVTAP